MSSASAVGAVVGVGVGADVRGKREGLTEASCASAVGVVVGVGVGADERGKREGLTGASWEDTADDGDKRINDAKSGPYRRR